MDYPELLRQLGNAPDDASGRLSFSAGVMHCGRIKRYIEICNASGLTLKGWVGRGWFERDWIVTGNVRDVRSFARWLGTYCGAVGE